jgi:UDP-glucose 4-epimerase
MSKSVYITGIAGFIGSTFAKRLVSEGYEVSGIDNLSGSDGSNLENASFAWEFGDFGGINDVNADVIVHLAAKTNARDYSENMIEENYFKTTGLLSRNADKRFIFASTCLVEYPQLNEYASSKYLAETYIQTFDSDYAILRFSNVYGPNQRDWGTEPNVLAAWRKARLDNQPIRIDGTGDQVRDFIHVDDVCEAIKLTIETPNATKVTLPICTGKQVSIRELAEIVYPNAERVYNTRHPLDYDYIYQSPSKAAAHIGFKAKKIIEDYGKERH